MSLPSRVGSDACALADRWQLSETLARKLVQLSEWWDQQFRLVPIMRKPPSLFVVGGYRTEKRNREVGGAPDSRHKDCPSTAADLRIGQVQGLSSDELWAILGGRWRLMGGRWGGTFSTPDPNHFDLG